jgi:CrcB protein
VLGVLTGLSVHHEVAVEVAWCLGSGLCGALTTYSTFSYETLRLHEGGARAYALANVAVSLVAGLASAALGYVVGAAL